jgi:hypothetical protein
MTSVEKALRKRLPYIFEEKQGKDTLSCIVEDEN